MKSSEGCLSGIYNYRQIGERLGTAGQPTKDQFRAIREAGFEVVINLALPTSNNALEDERSIVTNLGMSYVHIPVDFTAPHSSDFRTFRGIMNAFEDRRVFVHCAANMRVSAFVFLYRVTVGKENVTDAARDLHAIWQPDEVWSRFIEAELGTAKAG
jgi:protein tyrosine phosphatase (PTP) superfamily phosphohydrolase (DUF442 family)